MGDTLQHSTPERKKLNRGQAYPSLFLPPSFASKMCSFFFLSLSLSLFLLLFWGVARDIDNPVEYSLHVC